MAIARVGSPTTTTRSLAVDSKTITRTLTAGNLAVLEMAIYYISGTGGTIDSVSDGVNTWSLGQKISDGAGSWVFIYYAENVAPGSTTVTVDPNGGSANIELTMTEYSGIATTGSLDVTPTNSGTFENNAAFSASVASGALAQADEVLVAIVSHTAGDQTLTGDGTYTEIAEDESNAGQAFHTQDKIVASTSSDTADWTSGGGPGGFEPTQTWFACLCGFKAAAGGGGRPSFRVQSIRPRMFAPGFAR